MRNHYGSIAAMGAGAALALILTSSSAGMARSNEGATPGRVAQNQERLDASIFTYDGHDFIRVRTTLRTQDGKLAINTKLDHESPAYRALLQKRSYSGDATLFGHRYDASYAPLTSEDGRLTGALFVAVPK